MHNYSTTKEPHLPLFLRYIQLIQLYLHDTTKGCEKYKKADVKSTRKIEEFYKGAKRQKCNSDFMNKIGVQSNTGIQPANLVITRTQSSPVLCSKLFFLV